MTLEEFHAEWKDGHDSVIAHTSGSTGDPKPVFLLKSDMRASARATIDFFRLDADSTLACPLSVDYIAGKMMVVRADLCGGRLYMIEPSNHFDIPEGEITLLAIVPSQAVRLIENPHWAERIRNIIIGGASLGKEIRSELSALGYNVYESYGMTETCSHVALRHITDTTFQAMPGVTFATDSRDCLVVNAPHLSGERFVTNDVVSLYSTTSFVWKGRFDNVINSGGIKILPERLEEEIVCVMDDIPYYICGMADDKWGSVPVLVCQCGQEQAHILLNRVRQVVPHHRAPRTVIAVTALPTTANGKVVRKIP